MRRLKFVNALVALGIASLLGACATTAPPTVKPVGSVDLQRFMGDWYVIAHIPSRPERDAYNAVEHYALQADGTIHTTFRYRNNGFDQPLKTMLPKGFVRPGTNNAVWDMQFVWPIKAEYVIVQVDPAYTVTVIARSKRDYAWIMARSPSIPAGDYDAAVASLKAMGYSLGELRKVPQQWPEASGPRPPL